LAIVSLFYSLRGGKFDLSKVKNVIEAMVTAGLDNKMDAKLFGGLNANASALENTVNNLANDLIDAEIERPGRLNVENLAAQMIGAEVAFGVQTGLEQAHLAYRAYEDAQQSSQGQTTVNVSRSGTVNNNNNTNNSTVTSNSDAQQKQTQRQQQTAKQKAQNWKQQANQNKTKDWNPFNIPTMQDDFVEHKKIYCF
jgi:hypothetical protein